MEGSKLIRLLNAIEGVCKKHTDLQVGLYNPSGTEYEFIMFLTPEGDTLYLSQVADIENIDDQLSFREAREIWKGLTALGL